MSEVCTECGHPIGQHFQSIDGKVRCVFVERGFSTGGICGMPYEIHCDCVDYVAPEKRRREAAKKAENDAREKELDDLIAPILEAVKKKQNVEDA